MSVTLLLPYQTYVKGQIVSLGADVEASLIQQGIAVTAPVHVITTSLASLQHGAPVAADFPTAGGFVLDVDAGAAYYRTDGAISALGSTATITSGTISGISALTVSGSSAVQISSSATTSFRTGLGTPVGNPPGTVTLGTGGVGTLPAGTYKYAYYENVGSTTTGIGASQPSYAANGSEKIQVTLPLNRRGITSRVLCRTKKDGSVFYVLLDFGGSTGAHQTIYNDNTADSSLTVLAPTVDTSALFGFEENNSVKYFRTHPSVGTGAADVTFLTADPSTSGALSGDFYGTVFVRPSPFQEGVSVVGTGTTSTLYSGYYLTSTYDGVAGTLVYQINSRGSMVLYPQYDVDGLTITPSVATTGSIAHITAFAGSTGNGIRVDAPAGSNGILVTENTASFYSDRFGAVRAPTSGNCFLFGHSNAGYLSSLGAFSSNGYPTLAFYCYQGSNGQKRSSASNLPSVLYVDTSGKLFYRTAPAGTVDAAIADFSDILTITNAGTFTLSGPVTVNSLTSLGRVTAQSGTAIPAGGAAATGVMMTNTAGFGVFPGSGVPTVSAAKGSLYLRSDGSSTSTRAYINTDGGTTWTAITTAA